MQAHRARLLATIFHSRLWSKSHLRLSPIKQRAKKSRWRYVKAETSNNQRRFETFRFPFAPTWQRSPGATLRSPKQKQHILAPQQWKRTDTQSVGTNDNVLLSSFDACRLLRLFAISESPLPLAGASAATFTLLADVTSFETSSSVADGCDSSADSADWRSSSSADQWGEKENPGGSDWRTFYNQKPAEYLLLFS